MEIPPAYQDLLSFDKRAYAFLATVKKDGLPQVTPVWFDWDGTHLIVNSARGRVKDRVIRRNPRVSVCIIAPANMYRYIQIQGEVVEVTEEGARDMIDRLSQKYTGGPYRNYRGETRVTYRIRPVRVQAQG